MSSCCLNIFILLIPNVKIKWIVTKVSKILLINYININLFTYNWLFSGWTLTSWHFCRKQNGLNQNCGHSFRELTPIYDQKIRYSPLESFLDPAYLKYICRHQTSGLFSLIEFALSINKIICSFNETYIEKLCAFCSSLLTWQVNEIIVNKKIELTSYNSTSF